MGTWRDLRVAFVVGSVFMILLIVVYWDDVAGFSLYPVEDLKLEPFDMDPLTTPAPVRSAPASTTRPKPFFPLFPLPPGTSSDPSDPSIQEAGRAAEWQTDGGETEESNEENQGEEEQERKRAVTVSKQQEERKQRIANVCAGSLEFPERTLRFDQIPDSELDHLIVDDTNKIIYCYVPKVACTNWKRVMVFLSKLLVSPSTGKPYADPGDVPPELVHNPSLYLTFDMFQSRYGSQARQLMADKLQRYTKFLFVRDPFVRLISAFRNKFAKPNEDFYQQFGTIMLNLYGNLTRRAPKTAREAWDAGITPTFEHFIKYLLDPQTERQYPFNEHWRQVYRLCHPCQVHYDFIGHLENLETDSDELLKLLEMDHLFKVPIGNVHLTDTTWESDWFSQIPMDTRKKLYELFEPDFELFGYPKPDSVLQK